MPMWTCGIQMVALNFQYPGTCTFQYTTLYTSVYLGIPQNTIVNCNVLQCTCIVKSDFDFIFTDWEMRQLIRCYDSPCISGMPSTLQAHNIVVYYQYTSVYYQYFTVVYHQNITVVYYQYITVVYYQYIIAPLSPFRCMDAPEPGFVPTEWWVWLCPKARSDEKTQCRRYVLKCYWPPLKAATSL